MIQLNDNLIDFVFLLKLTLSWVVLLLCILLLHAGFLNGGLELTHDHWAGGDRPDCLQTRRMNAVAKMQADNDGMALRRLPSESSPHRGSRTSFR